jgi:hypothetical protein
MLREDASTMWTIQRFGRVGGGGQGQPWPKRKIKLQPRTQWLLQLMMYWAPLISYQSSITEFYLLAIVILEHVELLLRNNIYDFGNGNHLDEM